MGLLIYGVLFEKTGGNVLYILLIGTVLTTFFSSIQASLVRMMDPNVNILALGRDAATALVGPISFLGLITANLSRRLFMTYRHGTLIAGSVLIGIVVLAGGQFAVEHLTAFSVPVSVFITIMGGVYFLYLILRSKGL